MSGQLKRLGLERTRANEERFNVVSEAFNAIKEVKVGGLEQTYTQRFAKPAEVYAKGQATAQIIAQLPRYALEAIAFGGMLLLILFQMVKTGAFASSLPIIALYAFAGYRLMPALQQIYSAFTRIRFSGSALDALHRDLSGLEVISDEKTKNGELPFYQSIDLSNISYRYPDEERLALNGI